MDVVLSIFPGADLLGRGFELEGYCVVRGPDIAWGQDVRSFEPARHMAKGIIGGPPCPDFSKKRRGPPSGYGMEMLIEFCRCVMQGDPDWFLMENVPGVPTVSIPGYQIQRFNINANECGLKQNRLRSFQFGSKDGKPLVIDRLPKSLDQSQPCCLASEGKAPRRSFADFCELQGLPRDFDMPQFSRKAKYRAVGNGVPVNMARVVAAAIKFRMVTRWTLVCACDCGRPVRPGQTLSTAACRKRMQRRRDAARVTGPGSVTAGPSLFKF